MLFVLFGLVWFSTPLKLTFEKIMIYKMFCKHEEQSKVFRSKIFFLFVLFDLVWFSTPFEIGLFLKND